MSGNRLGIAAIVLASALPLSAATVKQVGVAREAPRPAEPRVTLDVKDQELRTILASVQKQCAIRNLAIDPGVDGKGTFFFHGVPCSVALSTVLESFGLEATGAGSAVTSVGATAR